MLGRKAAKHSLNVRGKGGHVGHHDHHIGRLPSGVVVEPVPKPVVQYLHFALRRMCLHHLNAGIVRHLKWLIWHGIQSQDVRLNDLKSCGLRVA